MSAKLRCWHSTLWITSQQVSTVTKLEVCLFLFFSSLLTWFVRYMDFILTARTHSVWMCAHACVMEGKMCVRASMQCLCERTTCWWFTGDLWNLYASIELLAKLWYLHYCWPGSSMKMPLYNLYKFFFWLCVCYWARAFIVDPNSLHSHQRKLHLLWSGVGFLLLF